AEVGDRGDGVDRGVVPLVGGEVSAGGLLGEPGAGRGERVGIAIEADHLPDAVVQQRFGVAPATEGTVEDERRAAKQLNDLGDERGGMIVGVPGTRGALVEASRSVGHTTAEPRATPTS